MKNLLFCSLVVSTAASLACAQDLRTPPPTSAPAAAAAPPAAATDVRGLLAQARQLREMKDERAALRLVKQVLERDERNIEALNEEGELNWILNDFDGTRRAFLYARQIQPNDFRANMGLGKLYANARNPRQAIYYFEVASRVAPADKQAEVFTVLAAANREAGQSIAGIPFARKAIEADPKYIEGRITLVQLLIAAQDFRAARDEAAPLVEQMRIASEDKPGDIEALRNLQRAYDLRLTTVQEAHRRLYVANADGSQSDQLSPGNEAEAAANLKEITDLFVRLAELNLMFTYLDAITFAEKAITYAPRDVDAIMTLAHLYRSVNNADKAAESARKALAIDKSNKPALELLTQLGAPIDAPPSATPDTQPAGTPPNAQPGGAPPPSSQPAAVLAP